MLPTNTGDRGRLRWLRREVHLRDRLEGVRRPDADQKAPNGERDTGGRAQSDSRLSDEHIHPGRVGQEAGAELQLDQAEPATSPNETSIDLFDSF